ncbi:hypothetical protein Tco_0103535 [Tanacetum coccineum]
MKHLTRAAAEFLQVHEQDQANNAHATFVGCRVYIEDVNHLSLQCHSLCMPWGCLFDRWQVKWVISASITEFVLVQDCNVGMPLSLRKAWKLIGPCATWKIWQARNEAIFDWKYQCWLKAFESVKRK